MTLEARVARLFAMDDETWRRHANPWSVWTRSTALPLLILAAWSRIWVGGRGALFLGIVALLWTWLNPRLFSPPLTTRSWASRAVLGERVWLNRKNVPVPSHHRRLPHLLNTFAALGVLVVIFGVWHLLLWPTLTGVVIVFFAKFWYLDRMVWLYDEMKDADPEYGTWLY